MKIKKACDDVVLALGYVAVLLIFIALSKWLLKYIFGR